MATTRSAKRRRLNAVDEQKPRPGDQYTTKSKHDTHSADTMMNSGRVPAASATTANSSKPRYSGEMPSWYPNSEHSVTYIDRCLREEHGRIFVHASKGGRIIGDKGQRMRQIERETHTRMKVTADGTWREILMSGSPAGILQAQEIIKKLFKDFNIGQAEIDRLDAAISRHIATQAVMPTLSNFSLKAPGGPLTSSSKASQVTTTKLQRQPSQLADILGDSSSSDTSSDEGDDIHEVPPQAPKLQPTQLSIATPSFEIAQDVDMGTASEDDSSLEEDKGPPQSELQTLKRFTPAATISRGVDQEDVSHVPEGIEQHTIDMTLDSDHSELTDSSSDDDSDARPSSKDATKIAQDLGLAPSRNMVHVEEVKSLMQDHKKETGKLKHKIKVLEYMLRYEGVADWKVARMDRLARLTKKGDKWDTQMQSVVGHARKGRKLDGEHPRRA